MAAIKVCGITDQEGLETALSLGVERIGLMFAATSPRCIDLTIADKLAQIARGKTKIVAVLVDPGDKQVKRIVDVVRPDFLQLHGKESPKRVRSLWKQFRIPIIKAFAISNAKDVLDANRFSTTAAEFLFDAKPPAQATRNGGLGIVFDWALLTAVKPARPYLLAGGLTAQNVGEAIRISGAAMVDVSSGVETNVGVKDPVLMEQFCTAAREQ